ncbi:MAG: LysE family transporter [Bacteroidota bacterium]
METLSGLLVGIGTGVFITWFPGMLNMQAVATACRVGKQRAYVFSAGLATVIAGQATLAVFFAGVFTRNPAFLTGIKEWAIPLFLALAAVFTAKGFRARAARKASIEQPYKGGPFWRGLMMSMMNILNIPLLLGIAGWLIAAGYLAPGFWPRLAYIPGTGLGALLIFFLYARLAEWISKNAAFFTRNINFFLGGLFVLLAAIQAWRIWEA